MIDQQSNILGIKYIKYAKHIGTPNDLVHRDAARSRSDGHESPTGKFLPTRTRTRRNPHPFVRVRDSRAHGHGFEGSRGYENPYSP